MRRCTNCSGRLCTSSPISGPGCKSATASTPTPCWRWRRSPASTPQQQALDQLLEQPDHDPDDLKALDAVWNRSGDLRRWHGRAELRPRPPPHTGTRCAAPATTTRHSGRISDMAEFINTLLFGIYPYVALVVLAVGSVIRYDREPYSWRIRVQPAAAPQAADVGLAPVPRRGATDLCRAPRRTAVAACPSGTCSGHPWHQADDRHQCWVASPAQWASSGPRCCCIAASSMPASAATPAFRQPHHPSSSGCSLRLGLCTIRVSMQHLDGEEMVKFMNWAQGIFTFNPAGGELRRRRRSDVQAAHHAWV
jgi:nitrate reductase gamma subunit